MKLHIVNPSAVDNYSYLNDTITANKNATTEIAHVDIKRLIFDANFIRDLSTNNIFLSDGSKVYKTIEESKSFLHRLTNHLSQIVGSDWLYTAAVDSVGRLATNANVTFPEVMYRVDNLRLNGSPSGSKALNVASGSFKFQPNLHSLSVPYYIEQLTFELEDQGDLIGTNFGAIAGLTNGLQLNIKSKGQVFQVCNLQDNSDIYNTFSEYPGSQSIGVLLQANRNMYFGTMTFQNRITLDPALGDYVEIVVRDSLTGLSTLTLRVTSWRTLG